MRISIVIPSLNQAKYLRDCIESVLAQEEETEIIVRDGGSRDGSVEILESYGDKIAWVSLPDGGQT